MNEFQCWMVVDECGDYAVGTTKDRALENYDTEIGSDRDETAIRFVRVPVMVRLPQPHTEVPCVTVPDED